MKSGAQSQHQIQQRPNNSQTRHTRDTSPGPNSSTFGSAAISATSTIASTVTITAANDGLFQKVRAMRLDKYASVDTRYPENDSIGPPKAGLIELSA